MESNDVLFQAVCAGNVKDVEAAVSKKLEDNVNALEILNNIMVPAMNEVGDRYSRNEIFLPEMLIAAKSMQHGIKILEPYLAELGHTSKGKLAIGTVAGDLHDIGKNIIVVLLKGAGYEVVDLGVDCAIEKYENAIKDGAKVILCSALLTTTMRAMKEIVGYIKENYPEIKVVVGGAPVTEDFAVEIKADAYGDDASCVPAMINDFLYP